MEEIRIPADVSQLEKVIQFIESKLDEINCGMKTRMQIDIAVEEVFVNIAHYAYPSGEGFAVIRFDFDLKTKIISIYFLDKGTPYDPLSRGEPDTTLSANEREIGGLGILMVKKTMDSVAYEYKDGQNVLSIQKHIG